MRDALCCPINFGVDNFLQSNLSEQCKATRTSSIGKMLWALYKGTKQEELLPRSL